MSRLIQLMGDGGFEELWNFPDDTTDEMIKILFKNYMNSGYESFEDYIESNGDFAAVAERVYVNEVYV